MFHAEISLDRPTAPLDPTIFRITIPIQSLTLNHQPTNSTHHHHDALLHQDTHPPITHQNTMSSTTQDDQPPAINFILSFLLVGLAWGLTTPFIRRAARDHRPPAHPLLETPRVRDSAVRKRVYGAFFGVLDLLRNPRYAVPLVLNLTGSVWFFLLIGKAGMCELFLFVLLFLFWVGVSRGRGRGAVGWFLGCVSGAWLMVAFYLSRE